MDNNAFLEAGSGTVADPGSPLLGNTWAQYWLLRQLQIDVCAREMSAKWECKLAGVDVMIRPNCRAAVGYVSIEA